MDEQFDDNLKKHISKAFESIEVPTADEGWLMLREKFPEKGKDRPVVWLWRAAAAVAAAVIILALGIWINYQNNYKGTIANKLPKVNRHEKSNDLLAKKTIPDAVIDNTVNPYNLSTDKKTIAKQSINKSYIVPNTTQISPKEVATPKRALDNDIKPIMDNYANTNLPTSITPNQTTVITSPTIIKDSTANKPEQNIAKQQSVNTGVLPTTNTYALQDNKATEPITDNEKKVKFGVYAATYFNYAKGSENQINMGVGFTSDIKISKKVKLSTGVAIAQNSLNYINKPSFSSPSSLLYNGNVSTNNTLGVANAYNFITAQSAPAVSDYNALLVGLDIPLNLKYEFNPQKSRSYIVVGVSSGTFINESYTYNFNTVNTPSFSNGIAYATSQLQQPESQTTKSSFTDFYFARTLNLSFGMGYQVGKNHLIIEPFLKYPLAGMGAQQIHFGAGGINLRFDFQSFSKKQ
ncbi:MAG: hypothetical protein EOP47_02380 [Sphingobacteriaceae bacterium]|nr:MAG: hypothetical protein EOP47_02380 [Sphingobacteriaceae bacterium]